MTAEELTTRIDEKIATIEAKRAVIDADRTRSLAHYDKQLAALRRAKTDLSQRAAGVLAALKDAGVC